MTNQRVSALGFICSLTLSCFGTLVLPCSAHGETDSLLSKIVAQQKAIHDRSTSYEYSVTMTGYIMDQGERQEVDTYCAVVRKGDAFSVTKEHYPFLAYENNISDLRQALRVCRLVANSEYVAEWRDVGVPDVYIHYQKDWQSEEQKAELNRRFNLNTGPNPFELAWTVSDGANTVADLLASEQKFAVDARPTWTVETVAGSDGTTEYVLKRRLAQEAQPDLIVTVDPDMDYVVTKCQSGIPGGDGMYRTVNKSYAKVGDSWCLIRMDLTVTESGSVDESLRLEFVISESAPAAPEETFALAGLGLPERALLHKVTPSGNTRGTSALLEYSNGEIIPLNDPNRQHALMVELGIIPSP